VVVSNQTLTNQDQQKVATQPAQQPQQQPSQEQLESETPASQQPTGKENTNNAALV
jgi:hypothetical protein